MIRPSAPASRLSPVAPRPGVMLPQCRASVRPEVSPQPRSSARAAFTLVELLVVIAIITILMGILIPVASRVRQTAYAARTQSTLAVIENAMERYYADFHAYPGPYNNDDIESGSATLANAGAAPINMTGNAMLGLVGGIDPTVSPMSLNSAMIGTGVAGLSLLDPKRYPAYLEIPSKQIGRFGGSLAPIPLDNYPESMPILYLRARVGAPGVISDGVILDSVTNATAHYQYDIRQYLPLLRESRGASPIATISGALSYFSNPNYPPSGDANYTGTPWKKDGYILISAGNDRIYGTSDDIRNFGSGH